MKVRESKKEKYLKAEKYLNELIKLLNEDSNESDFISLENILYTPMVFEIEKLRKSFENYFKQTNDGKHK